jgi:GAF domain-containing protein
VGAFFLDRYRYDAFCARRAADARLGGQQQEETEIAAALLEVAQALDVNLGTPDMLERVNDLACGTVGCDMCGTFIWERRGVRVPAPDERGVPQPVLDEISGIDFTTEALPMVAILRTGEAIEIAAPEGQDYLPADLMRRWRFSSVLYTPLVRRGETVGLVVYAYRSGRGPFSKKQRRLATGIAHATAIALQNARLIAGPPGREPPQVRLRRDDVARARGRRST